MTSLSSRVEQAREMARLARRLAPKARTFIERGIERARDEMGVSEVRAGRNLTVSVIVPNYNHASYLEQRLNTIVRQTRLPDEVIILDDASTDDSMAVIESYAARHPDLISVVANSVNSGSVFAQWRRGIEAATCDLVWLCESDDFAEIDFLERLLPEFGDEAVTVAVGRIQFADQQGAEQSGLDGYRQRALPDAWSKRFAQPAAWWFSGAFGVYNMIPNVGGCLFRRQTLPDSVWQEAMAFRVLGDWYLYIQLAQGGKIAFNPAAVSYFRQHGDNTSVEIQSRDEYFREHCQLAKALQAAWPVPVETVMDLYSQLHDQYERKYTGELSFLDLFSIDDVLRTERASRHALLGFIGFHVGGGEYFPIHLANELVEQGWTVSMLGLDETTYERSMFAELDPRIAVYWASDVRKIGMNAFLDLAGVDVIHSHNIGVEGLCFLESADPVEIPFITTLHGSYEVATLPQYELSRIVRGVDVWVSTAERNLGHLEVRPWDTAPQLKFPNAVGAPAVAGLSKADLGLDDQLIFTLIARPVEGKGWAEAIEAFCRLNETSQQPLHLLLVGEGVIERDLRERYQDHADISFLGFRSDAAELLALSDCCLLPTRFAGESQPLILIQAMQAGTAILSTTIGSIPQMVGEPHNAATLIEPIEDDAAFVDALHDAMKTMLDHDHRAELADNARRRGADFSMSKLASLYGQLYQAAIDESVEAFADSAGVWAS